MLGWNKKLKARAAILEKKNEALEDERIQLKSRVEDLKIEKKTSEEDIKYMVKMKGERLDIQHEKKTLELERKKCGGFVGG